MAMTITKDIWSSFLGRKILRRASKELTRSLPSVRILRNPLPLRRGVPVTPIALALALFALSPAGHAVTPAPDGGYPNGNTAEGTNALNRLTNGTDNTANGFDALSTDTQGSSNTAVGAHALQWNWIGGANTATGSQSLYSN